MRNTVMTARDINKTNTRFKAFRHDPSLRIIRPTPVSAARLDNLIATSKSIICHANLQIIGSSSICVAPRQYSGLQQFGTCSAVHCALEGLEPVDLTLSLSVAPRQPDGVVDGIDIFSNLPKWRSSWLRIIGFRLTFDDSTGKSMTASDPKIKDPAGESFAFVVGHRRLRGYEIFPRNPSAEAVV